MDVYMYMYTNIQIFKFKVSNSLFFKKECYTKVLACESAHFVVSSCFGGAEAWF